MIIKLILNIEICITYDLNNNDGYLKKSLRSVCKFTIEYATTITFDYNHNSDDNNNDNVKWAKHSRNWVIPL